MSKRAGSSIIGAPLKMQKSLDAFFPSSRPSVDLSWHVSQSVLYCQTDLFQYKSKTAAFDFDYTLAAVNGSHVFPKHSKDYRLFHHSVCKVLEALSRLGYAIVIFSNQSGALSGSARGDKSLASFKGRVASLVSDLNTYCESIEMQTPPVMVMAATEDDFFRKPRPGMFYWYKDF